ncbi:DUF7305 domain-containing protein [Salipaludibacillus sp. CF4.18]|uniref:DUF7305 domain-containing protein n=1 Tax=Salipaludibacillus sp. CF4.18 TaxID=3373081 RepID=UPI003EE81E09
MRHKFLSTKRLNNENGMALVLVLLLIMIFSVLTLGVIGVTSSNLTLTTGERDHQSSYYIAEAGINVRMQEIQTESLEAYNQHLENPIGDSRDAIVSAISTGLNEKKDFNNGIFLTEVLGPLNDEYPLKYTIKSEGIINNRSRKLTKDITINSPENNDLAVVTDESISLRGGASINGSVATKSLNENAITLTGGSSITQNISLHPDADNEKVINVPDHYPEEWWLKVQKKSYPSLTFPIFPTYPENSENHDNIELSGNDKFKWDLNSSVTSISTISLKSNTELTIDVGNSDKKLVVSHLNIINGHILIEGTGSLKIYVIDEITMGSGSSINNDGDIDQLQLFLKASDSTTAKTLKLSGNQKIFGSFFGEDTNIDLTAGSGFQGHILTGGTSVNISGGSDNTTKLFHAPNAHFSMSGGGSVTGRIISKSFEATGGSHVIMDKIEEDSLSTIYDGSNPGDYFFNQNNLIISTTPTKEQAE